MARKVTPEKVDGDNPEWSAEDVKRARPAGEVLPAELATVLPRKRGPKVETPKEQVTLRIDADVLAFFRAQGKGWQTRINRALKHAVEDEKAS